MEGGLIEAQGSLRKCSKSAARVEGGFRKVLEDSVPEAQDERKEVIDKCCTSGRKC